MSPADFTTQTRQDGAMAKSINDMVNSDDRDRTARTSESDTDAAASVEEVPSMTSPADPAAPASQPAPVRKITCPSCGTTILVRKEARGGRVRCPSCGRPVSILRSGARLKRPLAGVGTASVTAVNDHATRSAPSRRPATLFVIYGCSITAVLTLAVLTLYFASEQRERRRIEVANASVRETIREAEQWLETGHAEAGQRIEDAVAASLETPDSTELAVAQDVLVRVRERREALATDALFATAMSDLDASRIENAKELLAHYLSRENAPRAADAKRLSAEIIAATEPSVAATFLAKLPDQALAALAETGEIRELPPVHPSLVSIRLENFRAVLPVERARREKVKADATAMEEQQRTAERTAFEVRRAEAREQFFDPGRFGVADEAALDQEREQSKKLPIIDGNPEGRQFGQIASRHVLVNATKREIVLSDKQAALAKAFAESDPAAVGDYMAETIAFALGQHLLDVSGDALLPPSVSLDRVRKELCQTFDVFVDTSEGLERVNDLSGADALRFLARRFPNVRHATLNVSYAWLGVQLEGWLRFDAARLAATPDSLDCLTALSFDRHELEGAWNWEHGFLVNSKPDSRLVLPFIPDRDYRITVLIRRIEGSGPLCMTVPVGQRQKTLALFSGDDSNLLDDGQPHLLSVHIGADKQTTPLSNWLDLDTPSEEQDCLNVAAECVTASGWKRIRISPDGDVPQGMETTAGHDHLHIAIYIGADRYEFQDVRLHLIGSEGSIEWLHVSRPELRSAHDWLRYFLEKYYSHESGYDFEGLRKTVESHALVNVYPEFGASYSLNETGVTSTVEQPHNVIATGVCTVERTSAGLRASYGGSTADWDDITDDCRANLEMCLLEMQIEPKAMRVGQTVSLPFAALYEDDAMRIPTMNLAYGQNQKKETERESPAEHQRRIARGISTKPRLVTKNDLAKIEAELASGSSAPSSKIPVSGVFLSRLPPHHYGLLVAFLRAAAVEDADKTDTDAGRQVAIESLFGDDGIEAAPHVVPERLRESYFSLKSADRLQTK